MEDNLSAHYELVAEINASSTSQWHNGNGFRPIGDKTAPFAGRLYGHENMITGLTINRATANYTGLFGYTSQESLVSQIRLKATSINGSQFVGGLVGKNNGTIRNASVSGFVYGSEDVGGLVGYNEDEGLILNTTSNGSVRGSTYDTGGLVGSNDGTIRGASANTSVTGFSGVGGLVGRNDGTVEDASAHSFVNGSQYAGGLVGFNYNGTITNVSADGVINGSDSVGGLVGWNSGIVRIASSNASTNGSTNVGGLVGYNAAGGLVVNTSSSGSVRGSKYDIGGLVGENDGMIRGASATASVNGSEGVGGLVGFNDNGTITNVSADGVINGSDSVGGLVGFNSGIVRIASANASTNGPTDVGGLVGYNAAGGLVVNTSSSGSVRGSKYDIGGLVGENDGMIRGASATASVSGSEAVGGLVGFNDNGTIKNASAGGVVNGSEDVGGLVGDNAVEGTILDTFAVGSVSGQVNVGGLTGSNSGTVQDSYWDEQATGQATSAGNATGLTTAEMTGSAARTNMSGLEFGTVWRTQPNDYPALIAVSDPPDGSSGISPPTWLFAADVSTQNRTTVTVNFTLTNTGTQPSSYTLDLSLPASWSVVHRTGDGGVWRATDRSWRWQAIAPGASVSPSVTVTVPSDTPEGTYNVTATAFANGTVVAKTNGTITVRDVQPIDEAVDTDNDNQIDDSEILEAIEYWRTNSVIPNTGGKEISDLQILELIEAWRLNKEV